MNLTILPRLTKRWSVINARIQTGDFGGLKSMKNSDDHKERILAIKLKYKELETLYKQELDYLKLLWIDSYDETNPKDIQGNLSTADAVLYECSIANEKMTNNFNGYIQCLLNMNLLDNKVEI